MDEKLNLPEGLTMTEILKVAATAQGQAALAQLQASHPKELETAVAQAQAGDFRQVQQTITSFLNTSEGQALMKLLKG